jgi:ABC-type methionine transport system permease subunit
VVKINAKIKNILRRVIYWFFFIFIAYIIFEVTRKVLGGSLGFEALVVGLLIANLGYSFYMKESINKIDSKISGHIGWHKGKDGK